MSAVRIALSCRVPLRPVVAQLLEEYAVHEEELYAVRNTADRQFVSHSPRVSFNWRARYVLNDVFF